MADSISNTERNGPLGWLSDALSKTRGFMNNIDIKKSMLPTFLREKFDSSPFGIGDAVLGKSPEEVNEWAYGNGPLRVPPLSNVPQFKRTYTAEGSHNRAEGVVDTAFAAQAAVAAARLAPALARGATSTAKSVLEAALEHNPFPAAPLRRGEAMAAVRRKGGNFNEERLDDWLEGLGVAPDGADYAVNAAARSPGTSTWGKTQLRNYIRKDLGAPTDPLLAVEKEYPSLHMPEGHLVGDGYMAERYTYAMRGRPGKIYDAQRKTLADHAALSGAPDPMSPEFQGRARDWFQQPGALTPWGEHSSNHLEQMSVPGYSHEVGEIMDKEPPRWLENAPADTKIWAHPPGIIEAQEGADPLHFGHVLDYLDAAQAPYSRYRDFTAHHESIPGAQPVEVEGAMPYTPFKRVHTPETIKEADDLFHSHNDMLPFRRAEMDNWFALHNAGLTLTPEQVARTSVADAVRKTAQWNKHLAENAGEANENLSRGIVAVHKEYPEHGMRWVRLGQKDLPEMKLGEDGLPEGWSIRPDDDINHATGHPWQPGEQTHPWLLTAPPEIPGVGGVPAQGSPVTAHVSVEDAIQRAKDRTLERYQKQREADLSSGLNAEGEAMGHCVGGYCDDVADRGTEIYSLRDKNNTPHVTVEVRQPKTLDQAYKDDDGHSYDYMLEEVVNQLRRKPAPPGTVGSAPDAFREAAEEYADHGMLMGWLKKNYPDVHDAFNAPGPPTIEQIKGKQNAAPVEKYLPFVQDFVKSGQWGRVGDLSNTGGLVKFNGGKTNIRSPGKPQPHYLDLDMPAGYYTLPEASQFLQKQGVPAPIADRHVGNIQGMMDQSGDTTPGYAHGGRVVPRYSKKAELLSRLGA